MDRLMDRFIFLTLVLSIFTVPFLHAISNDATAQTDGDFQFFVGPEGGAIITGYSGPGGEVVIPSLLYDGTMAYPTVAIGVTAFYGCSTITSIILPDSVTAIGSYAFSECIALTSVVMPGSVGAIGSYAFNECTSLASVVIPGNVTTIEEATFSYCFSLASVVFPDGLTRIGAYAFIYCPSLTSVSIPGNVTIIEQNAFFNCPSLVSVEIPGSVNAIGNQSFSLCTALTALVLGEGVTSIGSGAFSECEGLFSLDLPESILTIGDRAFQKCISLRSAVVPRNLTHIGDHAFSGCDNLTEMTFLGNAPTCAPDWVSDRSSALTIYYLNGSGGFTTPEWSGMKTTRIDQPESPRLLTAVRHGEEVTVTWEIEASGMIGAISGYELYCGTGLESENWTMYGVYGPEVSNATVDGLDVGTTYYFGMKAINIAGTSPMSNVASIAAKPVDGGGEGSFLVPFVLGLAFLVALALLILRRGKG